MKDNAIHQCKTGENIVAFPNEDGTEIGKPLLNDDGSVKRPALYHSILKSTKTAEHLEYDVEAGCIVGAQEHADNVVQERGLRSLFLRIFTSATGALSAFLGRYRPLVCLFVSLLGLSSLLLTCFFTVPNQPHIPNMYNWFCDFYATVTKYCHSASINGTKFTTSQATHPFTNPALAKKCVTNWVYHLVAENTVLVCVLGALLVVMSALIWMANGTIRSKFNGSSTKTEYDIEAGPLKKLKTKRQRSARFRRIKSVCMFVFAIGLVLCLDVYITLPLSLLDMFTFNNFGMGSSMLQEGKPKKPSNTHRFEPNQGHRYSGQARQDYTAWTQEMQAWKNEMRQYKEQISKEQNALEQREQSDSDESDEGRYYVTEVNVNTPGPSAVLGHIGQELLAETMQVVEG